MTMHLMPLGKIRDIVQSTGLDISYAYDDLVFSDHSVFILRFDADTPHSLYLHFNSDCNQKESERLKKVLMIAGKIGGFVMVNAGLFSVEQSEEKEEIQIRFL
jgi:hypothetical protein